MNNPATKVKVSTKRKKEHLYKEKEEEVKKLSSVRKKILDERTAWKKKHDPDGYYESLDNWLIREEG